MKEILWGEILSVRIKYVSFLAVKWVTWISKRGIRDFSSLKRKKNPPFKLKRANLEFVDL